MLIQLEAIFTDFLSVNLIKLNVSRNPGKNVPIFVDLATLSTGKRHSICSEIALNRPVEYENLLISALKMH